MKKYITPSVKFNKFNKKNIVTTSNPGLEDEAADNSQVLSPERNQNSDNW